MRKWFPTILLVGMIVTSVVAFPHLPESVPTHWDLQGNPNGYSSRLVAVVLLPLMFVAAWVVMRALPKVDPWQPNYAKMQGAYDLMINAVLSMLAVAHASLLGVGAGLPIPLHRIVPVGVGVLFIVIGNVMPLARPNFWFGIRTPWTLTNPRVWERTHRVGGYLMAGAGVLGIVTAFLPIEFAILALTLLGAGASFITMIYSYFAWRQETSR